jgi:hypothetical protein
MNTGFVVIHRKIMEWEWYSDTNTFRVFLHLLLKANHKPTKFRGFEIGRGQVIIGRKALAKTLKLSEREVRTAIEHLKMTGELTIKSTHRFSGATLTKYTLYQDRKPRTTSQATSQATSKRPASDQQATTSKQCNNVNNETKETRTNKVEGSDVDITNQPPKPKEVLQSSPPDFSKIPNTIKALGLPATAILSPRDHDVLNALLESGCNFSDIEQARIKRKKSKLEWIQDTVCEMRDARLATVAKVDHNGIPILPNGRMDWDNMTYDQKMKAMQLRYEL